MSILSIGQTWNNLSTVGKLAAVGVAGGLTLAAAYFAVQHLRKHAEQNTASQNSSTSSTNVTNPPPESPEFIAGAPNPGTASEAGLNGKAAAVYDKMVLLLATTSIDQKGLAATPDTRGTKLKEIVEALTTANFDSDATATDVRAVIYRAVTGEEAPSMAEMIRTPANQQSASWRFSRGMASFILETLVPPAKTETNSGNPTSTTGSITTTGGGTQATTQNGASSGVGGTTTDNKQSQQRGAA